MSPLAPLPAAVSVPSHCTALLNAPPSRPLILGSSSPYRRELLGRLQLPFSVVVPDVDESPRPGEPPAQMAQRLALAKAQRSEERRVGEDCIYRWWAFH